MVAAYFAVESEHGGDSALYAFTAKRTVGPDDVDPFSVAQVMKFRPPYINATIVVQKAVFTVHPDPVDPFDDESRVTKAIIKQSARLKIKNQLYKYGISHAMLFPGLDGIARDLDWRYTWTADGLAIVPDDQGGRSLNSE